MQMSLEDVLALAKTPEQRENITGRTDSGVNVCRKQKLYNNSPSCVIINTACTQSSEYCLLDWLCSWL